MKIRQGFVSNSSSTSFIVAYKNKDSAENFCKVVDLNDFIETMANADRYCDDTDVEAFGQESVLKYIKKEIKQEWIVEDYKGKLQKILNKIEEMEDSIWEFLYFKLSYHNKVARDIFNAMVEQGDVKVFSKENE